MWPQMMDFWEAYGGQIANAAVVIAAIIAALSIRTIARLQRDRFTVDVISTDGGAEVLASKRIIKAHSDHWAKSYYQLTEEDREAARIVMNHYGRVKVLITKNMIHGDWYLSMYWWEILYYWGRLMDFVYEIRRKTSNDQALNGFEQLAEMAKRQNPALVAKWFGKASL